MHARIDQLLSLRDGEPIESDVRLHVQQCTACAADLVRLERTREQLRAMAPIEPPGDLWADIEARGTRPHRSFPLRAIGACAALLVVGAVALGLRDSHSPQSHVVDAGKQVAHEPNELNELDDLIAQSRELEALLEILPERRVERVSTVATLDVLEQRIQWLDWQLANASDETLDRRQTRQLWSERVDLMDSLVKVRYADSAPIVF